MIIFAALCLASCDDYDDTELWNKVNGLEERIAALEEWQKTTDNNLNALQTLINTMDYITSVAPIMQANDTIGYTINFHQSNPISIYNGTTSQIGITQDEEGNWLWTLDGEILTTSDGTPIPANGQDAAAPQLSTGKALQDEGIKTDAAGDAIIADIAYLSVDEGETWYRVTGEKGEQGDKGNTGSTGATGPAGPAGANGDSFFQDVKIVENNVIFTLADGTTFTVAKYNGALTFMQNGTALDLTTTIDLADGTLTYAPSDAEVSARIIDGEGWSASAENGTITISPGSMNEEATLEITLLENGRVIETYRLTIEQTELQGEGTAAAPYTVSSAAELAYIAEQVNNNKTYYNGKYIKLTQDIILTDNWTPVGPPSDESGYFQGTFDGGEHIISDLIISNSATNTHGLFGKIGSKAVIKNLTIDSPKVSGFIEVGALVGYNNGGIIENCHVRNAQITGAGKVGGLVGINSGGNITNCSVTGTISGTNGNDIGGIVGMGDIFASDFSITSCWFNGTISNTYQNAAAGGIIGSCNDGVTITACYSTGTFSAVSTDNTKKGGLGGIVGSAINYADVKLIACYSTAKLTHTGDATNKYIGGIVGYKNDSKNIISTISATSCYWNCEGATYGLGSINSSENATQIVGNDWSAAMSAMNTALTGTGWRYETSSDTSFPLVIKATE